MSKAVSSYDDKYAYQNGYLNHFSTEALPNALPKGQNTPQQCPYGLYAEQLNGTPFTAPRVRNLRSWLYRIRPSAAHGVFRPYNTPTTADQCLDADFAKNATPKQFRWMPPPIPDTPTDFVDGLYCMVGAGSPQLRTGFAVHMYLCNKDMVDRAFTSADGDMLIVPQQGALDVQTEMGNLHVKPLEIVVIPKGIRFAVKVSGPSRGYITEVFQGHFTIPDLGPIGANGLANQRDFLTPVAAYEDVDKSFELIHKYQGKLFIADMDHSVFDVVAWHGNYAPAKYDLTLYNTVNTVSYDHMDPSIFTVLTCQSSEPGTAVVDFVIFPPRWSVAEGTFKPPYYHRNLMNEFMGLIEGIYEAKEEGFLPGGASLHSCMSAHGPESAVHDKASTAELKPERVAEGSMAFMFESVYMMNPTDWALNKVKVDETYQSCWTSMKKHFNPNKL